MDCTMGKPVSFLKKGTNKPMTVAVRMTRLENMESKNYIVLIILFLLSILDYSYWWENWWHSQSSAVASKS